MNANFIILMSIFFIVSCTTSRSCPDYNKTKTSTDTDQYYQSSGITQYMLPELPVWANFSSVGKCSRTRTIRYINIDSFGRSFHLSYKKLIQFQYMYNHEYKLLQKNHRGFTLPLNAEEQLFYNVLDKIEANVEAFKVPTFKRINIVWIDPFINGQRKIIELKRLMKKKSMDLGHPVFITLCLDYSALEEFMAKNGFRNNNIRLMPASMFSIYTQDGLSINRFHLKLDAIFNKNQVLYLYLPTKQVPESFDGTFKTVKY